MYKIILKDNTEFTASLNGNNYITSIDVSNFNFDTSNLTTITIIDMSEETQHSEQVYTNMKCTNKWDAQDGTHIIFDHRTEQELVNAKLKAALDYVAMMTEVNLDE